MKITIPIINIKTGTSIYFIGIKPYHLNLKGAFIHVREENDKQTVRFPDFIAKN